MVGQISNINPYPAKENGKVVTNYSLFVGDVKYIVRGSYGPLITDAVHNYRDVIVYTTDSEGYADMILAEKNEIF